MAFNKKYSLPLQRKIKYKHGYSTYYTFFFNPDEIHWETIQISLIFNYGNILV